MQLKLDKTKIDQNWIQSAGLETFKINSIIFSLKVNLILRHEFRLNNYSEFETLILHQVII